MNARVTAAARTPWAPRHGALQSVRPETLLIAAVGGAMRQRGLDPDEVDLVLVACDTTVGSQDLNLGRRAMLAAGWPALPALTIDGQRTGDLALIEIAASRPGCTVIAAVDSTSMVPPGAGLVRDYGRPTLEVPEHLALEDLAVAAGLTRARLDHTAAGQRGDPHADDANGGRTVKSGIVAVEVSGGAVSSDVGVGFGDELEPADLEAISGDHGIVTAWHQAPLADGAAAVVIETGRAEGRELERCKVAAVDPDQIAMALRAHMDAGSSPAGPTMLADGSAVLHALLGLAGGLPVASVASLGSTPSADGLRMLVDGYHALDEDFTVLRAGRFGQLVSVSLAAR